MSKLNTRGFNRPIFIIGAPRSGTTLLRLMLDSHKNISCGPETHFLGDMELILSKYWEMIQHFGFSEEYWQKKIKAFYESFQIEYMQRKGKRRWAEKTPTYTLRLPFLERLFPTAQFVHIIRDPRAVVASHRERWGSRRAYRSISQWIEYVRLGQSLSQSVGKERYHELRYEHLIRDPEITMRALLEFLGEPWDPAVIEYDLNPHDVGRYVKEFSEKRQSELDSPERFYTTRLSPSWRRIGPTLMVLTLLKTNRLRRELGY